MYCKNCGKEIDDNAVVCVNCGCAVKDIQTANASQGKSWVTTLLLCFFLGSLGIHRFYTGHIASGIAQLIMTIVVILFPITALWVLIDFIVILCGGFRTKDGAELRK